MISSYFVYAFDSRASFVASCNFIASSAEVMNQLKAGIGANIEQVAAVTHEMQASLKEKGEHIRTEIALEVTGFDPRGDSKGDMANLKEIATAFKTFQKNAKPVPYMASLVHYSAIDSRIPLPAQQFKDLSFKLSTALQRVYMLQSEILSSPMSRAKLLSEKISKTATELLEVKPTDEAMDEWLLKIDDYTLQAKQWSDREQLLKDAVKLTTKDYVLLK